jgi:hypothetical protein
MGQKAHGSPQSTKQQQSMTSTDAGTWIDFSDVQRQKVPSSSTRILDPGSNAMPSIDSGSTKKSADSSVSDAGTMIVFELDIGDPFGLKKLCKVTDALLLSKSSTFDRGSRSTRASRPPAYEIA